MIAGAVGFFSAGLGGAYYYGALGAYVAVSYLGASVFGASYLGASALGASAFGASLAAPPAGLGASVSIS